MLALVQTLQECAEVSQAKTGILCEADMELQQCITPLMTLKGDDIVEAILLRPTRGEPGPSPTTEEKTTLLGKEDEPLEAPGPSPRHLGISRFVEPAERTTTPITPAPSCLAPKPHSFPSQKGKKLGEGIDVNPNNPSQWV